MFKLHGLHEVHLIPLARLIRFIAAIRPGFVRNLRVDDKLTTLRKMDQRVRFQAFCVHTAYRRLKLVLMSAPQSGIFENPLEDGFASMSQLFWDSSCARKPSRSASTALRCASAWNVGLPRASPGSCFTWESLESARGPSKALWIAGLEREPGYSVIELPGSVE